MFYPCKSVMKLNKKTVRPWAGGFEIIKIIIEKIWAINCHILTFWMFNLFSCYSTQCTQCVTGFTCALLVCLPIQTYTTNPTNQLSNILFLQIFLSNHPKTLLAADISARIRLIKIILITIATCIHNLLIILLLSPLSIYGYKRDVSAVNYCLFWQNSDKQVVRHKNRVIWHQLY